MAFVTLMAGTGGRAARVVAGLVLLAVGLLFVRGAPGAVVAAVGLVPLAAGVFDVCLVAPLIGAPLRGAAIREAAAQRPPAGAST